MAVVSVWVSDTCHARTPRDSASAAAAPWSASDGRAAVVVAHHLDVAERERAQAGAECLHRRFLGPEAHRQTRHRIVVLVRVLLLTVGEETVRERHPPLQREPEPLDLDQVGPQAADPEGGVDHDGRFSASGRRGRRPAR